MRAELPTVECYFHEGELTTSEILEQQLIENCLREDLRPTEEAVAFEKLMELNGWSQKRLATALRLSETRITRALSLLKLASELREQVDAGEISARSAYEISKLPDVSAQKKVARRAVESGLTCNQVSSAVRQRRGKAKPKPRSTRLTFAAEDGWTVVVSAARKGTYHEVEQALRAALEEVQLRIRNNVQLY